MFNEQELKNISVLISKAQIIGQDAITVALLQQKIADLLKKDDNNKENKKA